jgi:hypothetical protein
MDAAYIEFDGLTISTATTTNLTGGTVGQEKVKGTSMSVDNTTGRVEITEDGIYAAWLDVEWDGSFTALKLSRIIWVTNGDQENARSDNIIGEPEPGIGLDLVSVSSVRFVNYDVTGNNFVQAAVRQQSGSNKDISIADFTVVRLAAIEFP